LLVDQEHPCLNLESDSSMDHLQAASIHYRIAIGPHAGREALAVLAARGPPDSLPERNLT